MTMTMQQEMQPVVIIDMAPQASRERENLLEITAQLKQILKEAIAALS